MDDDRAAGADAHLNKPVSAAELAGALQDQMRAAAEKVADEKIA